MGFLIMRCNQPDWFCRSISRRWGLKTQVPHPPETHRNHQKPLWLPAQTDRLTAAAGDKAAEALCRGRQEEGAEAGWEGSRG